MPRRFPPHVDCFKDKGGTRRVYFRRGRGPRTPLPADPSSDAFRAAYAAALAAEAAPKPKVPKVGMPEPGSIAALCTSYLRSPGYVQLKPTTKAGYRTSLEAIREKHGHRSVSGLTRERVVRMMEAYADRPGAGYSFLKMLRILVRHAIVLGMLKNDPTLAIRRPKLQGFRSWTDSEIAAFEAAWPVGTKQRLAFALLLFTGQRRSDVHRMTWADVDGGTIRVLQQKTGRKLSIAMHRDLRAVLDATPREHLSLLHTAYGQSFTVDGFSRFMRDAIAAAGLPLECSPHGLRKAAGRRLADAGCTPHEIMAVLGHTTLSEAERYTREANQQALSKSANAKLEAQTANRFTQSNPLALGKSAKKGANST